MSRLDVTIIDKAVSDTDEASGELQDLVEGLEAVLEAHAAGVIDLPPALARLLVDLAEAVAGEIAT